jgi:hypothetical protein
VLVPGGSRLLGVAATTTRTVLSKLVLPVAMRQGDVHCWQLVMCRERGAAGALHPPAW